MAGFDTDDEVIAALEAHRVPCSKVLSPADFAHQPHLVERGVVRTVADPVAGPVDVPGFPLVFDGDRPQVDEPAPMLGEHNREVLTGLLGWSDGRVDALEATGVLQSKPR